MNPIEKFVLWLIQLKGNATPLGVDSWIAMTQFSLGWGRIVGAFQALQEQRLIEQRQLSFAFEKAPQRLSSPYFLTEKGKKIAKDLPDDPRTLLDEIRKLPGSETKY